MRNRKWVWRHDRMFNLGRCAQRFFYLALLVGVAGYVPSAAQAQNRLSPFLADGGNTVNTATKAITPAAESTTLAAAADDEVEALLRQAAEDDAKSGAAPQSAGAAANAPATSPVVLPDMATLTGQAAAPLVKPSATLQGFAQFELARALDDPSHWSKMLTRVELGRSGKINDTVKWKVSARVDYDAVFEATDFYPSPVRSDQRFNASFRETYLDMDAGDWDIRLGRQHVVWGEMVSLFFADVVSARDMREFILPEFNILRIPQWAARAEYFKNDFHGELLWIPLPTYDETGKPGSEFFPVQPEFAGFSTRYLNEHKPSRRLANSNFGARGSWLTHGWDLSGFFYRSMDAAPTFYRRVVLSPQPEVIYEARHDRISQVGGTLAKDFGSMVLKTEMVATRGRRLGVLRLTEPDGVVRQNTFDWVVGLDVPLPSEARFNVQLFQSVITNHDADVIPKKVESGYSLLLNGKLLPQVEAEVLWVASFNRTDWMLRPKVTWTFEKNWRMTAGADIFHGPPEGLFGRYEKRDRLFSELKYYF